MAKKKKDNNLFDNLFDGVATTPEEKVMVEAVLQLIEGGFTPKEYEMLYEAYHNVTSRLDDLHQSLLENGTKSNSKSKSKSKKSSEPVKGLTYKLKVQMRGVSKPPVWREVYVPSSFTFDQLHEAIQALYGFFDSHMWNFGIEPYDDSLCIAEEGLVEDCTHDSSETYLSEFFKQKGDRLAYIYDYGDSWIFDISLVDVEKDELMSPPRLGKWKGDLQPTEDTGGIYAYLEMREFLENQDKLTKKERVKRAEALGYDDLDCFMDMLDEAKIDIDHIEERLSEI
jgi:hypothetical protein